MSNMAFPLKFSASAGFRFALNWFGNNFSDNLRDK